MKQFVICNANFLKEYDRILSSGKLILNGEETLFALIEKNEILFDEKLFPNQVLVKKSCFSCNYRDLSLIKLANMRLKRTEQLSYYSIGSEFSAVVIQIGSNVTKIRVGDRVICDASYPFSIDKAVAPGLPTNHASSELEIIHEDKLAIMPINMSMEIGAAFTVGAQTVYSMIEKLQIERGHQVLITGIKSNTSLFAISILKYLGIEPVGLSRNKVDENWFGKLGLKRVFYISDEQVSFLQNSELANYISEFGKFDRVIDPFGDNNLFRALDVMNINSKYITCGLSNQTSLKPISIDVGQQILKIVLSNIAIMGNCLGGSDNLRKALTDFSNERWGVVIDDVIKHDSQRFMERNFNYPKRLGKVIFSYE